MIIYYIDYDELKLIQQELLIGDPVVLSQELDQIHQDGWWEDVLEATEVLTDLIVERKNKEGNSLSVKFWVVEPLTIHPHYVTIQMSNLLMVEPKLRKDCILKVAKGIEDAIEKNYEDKWSYTREGAEAILSEYLGV